MYKPGPQGRSGARSPSAASGARSPRWRARQSWGAAAGIR